MGDEALFHILPEISDERLQVLKYVNFLAALRSRVKKSKVCYHLPIELTVDFTTTCQLHCPYCSVGNGTIHRTSSHISIPLYSSLMNDVGDALFFVWNFSAGEPLLHKQCADLIKIGTRHEVFSIISSNLSMNLSTDTIDDILQSGLRMLSVSMDGINEASYSKYRRGGDFNLVLDNLAAITKRKRKLGLVYPIVEWRYLIFEHNQADVESAKQMAVDIGVDLLEFHKGYAPADSNDPENVRPMTQPMPSPCVLGPALEWGKLRTTPSLRAHISERKAILDTASPDGNLCDWMYYSGMVYPDGAVGPCCVATDKEDDFADLKTDAFSRLWNNNAYQRARQHCVDGTHSGTVCDRCPAPFARRYQFRNRLRAILMNAPDWVLYILHASPQDFFLPDDNRYMPVEIDAITEGAFLHSASAGTLLKEKRRKVSRLGCSTEHTRDMLDILDNALSLFS